MANPVAFPGRPFNLRMHAWVSSQDVANNRSLIGWQLIIDKTAYSPTSSGGLAARWMKVNGGYVHEYYGNGFNFISGDTFVIGEGSVWVTHTSDGSKTIALEAAADFDLLGATSVATASITPPTIPRASTSTFSPDNQLDPGVAVTINTNRASTSFDHQLAYTLGGVGYTLIQDNVGASASWSPPISLLNQIPNGTSLVGNVRTRTYSGSTLIGTTTTNYRLHVPTSVVPTFTDTTVAEATAGVAANVGAYVQGVSKLALAIVGAAGAYSSTIVSHKIEILKGTTVLQTINTASGTSTPLTQSGTLTIRSTITDSRGRTAVQTKDITVLAWAPPKIIAATAKRSLSTGVLNDEGTYIRVDLNASVTSLMNTTQRNALRYKISTRLRGTTTWTVKSNVTTAGLTFNSNVVNGTYPITDAFDVLVEVLDDFATSAQQFLVTVSAIFMHWDASLGVGIGKYREHGMLDVAGTIWANNAQVEPPGIIHPYAGATAPAGFLTCDGQAVPRVGQYAALYAVIGTTYGTGDGSTTFNVPNLKGRIPVGIDGAQTEFNLRGETGGSKTHDHPLGDAGGAQIIHVAGGGVRSRRVSGPFPSWTANFETTSGTAASTAASTVASALTGATEAGSTLQPYMALHYIIKY